eukprot:240982_1
MGTCTNLEESPECVNKAHDNGSEQLEFEHTLHNETHDGHESHNEPPLEHEPSEEKSQKSNSNSGGFRCHLCKNINNASDDNSLSFECKNCKTIHMIIPITVKYPFQDGFQFRICAPHSTSVTIEDLFDKIDHYLYSKLYPTKHYIWGIHESFAETTTCDDVDKWSRLCGKSITEYNKWNITHVGLTVYIMEGNIHKINRNIITCKYLINDDDPLKCPIYKSAKYEYAQKDKCRYGQECKSFIRLANGEERVDDEFHIKLYNHPPRNNRQIQLAENMHKLIIGTKQEQVPGVHGQVKSESLSLLIEEVINHGYKYDLCLICSANDNCQHDVHKTNSDTLLSVVDKKLNHVRHKQLGSPLDKAGMLALILYTSCDCNYDLCSSQRNGNYIKWKCFDYSLHIAIKLLHEKEHGSYKLYSGLNHVKLDKKEIECGYFVTYVSSSWSKDVALAFMNGEGLVIEMDEKLRKFFRCCDVSWVSKFPDECEILIDRSFPHDSLHHKLVILDEQNGVQTVGLNAHGSTGTFTGKGAIV